MDANSEKMMKCHNYLDMDLLYFYSRSFVSIRGWFVGVLVWKMEFLDTPLYLEVGKRN
jgi:hypothetical protein